MANRMNEPGDDDGPTSAKLQKLLECPVCFESPMIESVYQCETGHSVCSNCRTKLDKCGVCEKKFTGTRNYVAEHIAESFKFYCKHKDEGCAVVNTGRELNLHQMNCSYRPVLCNYIRKTPCKNNPIKVGDFISHLKNVHGCPGIDDCKGGSVELTETSSLTDETNPGPGPSISGSFYVKFNEKYFVHQTHFAQHNVHWWVYLIGTPEDAKNYKYKLTILPAKESLRNKNVKIKYKLPVQSIYDHHDFEKISLTGELASYPKAFLKPISINEGNSPNEVWKWDEELKIIEENED